MGAGGMAETLADRAEFEPCRRNFAQPLSDSATVTSRANSSWGPWIISAHKANAATESPLLSTSVN